MQPPNLQELAHEIDEARQRIEGLERLLHEEQRRFQDLVSHLLPLLLIPRPSPNQELDGAGKISKDLANSRSVPEVPNRKRLIRAGKVDGRSRFSPEKYLKISVVRTLGWARRYGKSAEVAGRRVSAVVQERAKHYGLDAVPESVQAYMESAVREYE